MKKLYTIFSIGLLSLSIASSSSCNGVQEPEIIEEVKPALVQHFQSEGYKVDEIELTESKAYICHKIVEAGTPYVDYTSELQVNTVVVDQFGEETMSIQKVSSPNTYSSIHYMSDGTTLLEQDGMMLFVYRIVPDGDDQEVNQSFALPL